MFEECIYFNLNALARDLNRLWERHFTEVDLSPPLGYLLMAVLQEPGRSQRDLAEVLQLERSTITRFLETLESRGLIRRESTSADARISHVFPTEKGLALRPRLNRVLRNIQAELEARMQGSEIPTLLKVTAKLKRSLKT
ncbi:MAG: MarR family winged helix-turn-helix transcriptional regulator [Bdellovibrionales bacterium]